MSDDFLGHAIENGRVRFFSVSAVEKGDPRSNGCAKRYANRYVFGFKEDESEKNKEAKEFGINGHKRIADYLKTGIPALEACELRGRQYIPTPGADLWVEQPFHRVEGKTITSSLHAAGVPFVGYIDCGDRRGSNQGGDFEPPDPPGTVEVRDWKFKGTDLDRFKNPTYKHRDELVHSIQMAGYGCVVGNTQPDVEHVRLSHVYFFKKPGANPRKVTKLHVIDDCRETWKYVEGVARTLIHVASETDIEKVPGNVRACDTYGGCPYREAKVDENGRVVRPACSTYQKNSLDVLYGRIAADFSGAPTMPLLSQVMPAAPNMQQQLAAEEAAARAQQAQLQQQAPTPMTLVDAWNIILKSGRGQPALGGNAAQAYAQACGQTLAQGAGYAGTGQLGGLQLMEVSHILQLAGEIAAQAQGQQPPPPPLMQAPPQMSAPMPIQTQTMPAAGALPPDAPPSMPQLAMQHQAPPAAPAAAPLNQPIPAPQDVPLTQPPAQAQAQAADAAPAKKRGRPKTDSTPTQEQTAAQPQATSTPMPQSSAPQATSASASLFTGVFVDCIPNMPFTDLHAWIADVNARLAKNYCVAQDGKPTVQDIRCAPKHQDAFAFGAWKGALYDVVVHNPPPQGVLYIDTRTSELAAVVADAMQTVCEQHGVLYVRGVR